MSDSKTNIFDPEFQRSSSSKPASKQVKPKGIPLIVIGNSLGDSRQRQFLKTVLDTHAIAYIETDESPDWWLAPNDRHLSLLGHSRYAQLLAEAIKTAVTRP